MNRLLSQNRKPKWKGKVKKNSNILAYRKSGTQDPKVGPGTRDPGPLGGTLMWDPTVGP